MGQQHERRPLELAADHDPWERQPSESETHYGRFALYRDMGRERSLKQLGETLRSSGARVSQPWLYQISSRHRWDERTRAWDNEQDRLLLALTARKRRDMAERHARLASGMIGKALAALAQLVPADLAARDLIRMIEVATRLEREALGEPGQTIAVTGRDGGPVMVDYSNLTPEQRQERLAELAAEAARRAGAPLGADDDGE